MKKHAVLLCGLALTALPTPMFADSFFNFAFTGNSSVSGSPGTPFSGSGQFDAQTTATPGKYKIVGVTGTTDGETISGIIAPQGFFSNDNFLFFTAGSSSASLDNGGVAYVLANRVDTSLFYGVPGQYQQELFGFPGALVSESQVSPVTITPVSGVSPVPEPGSLVLLGTGLIGAVGAIRRRLQV